MGLVINHNMMAMNAARNLSNAYGDLSKSTERLSSGLRIVTAADDAAGLAVREMMRSDIAVLNQGLRNASDAISLLQTAEGALGVIDEKLIRMKELAEQAATGTYTTVQREIMDSEYQAMAAEIDRIAESTDFNRINLLNGALAASALHEGSGLKVHFGVSNSSSEDYYYIKIGDMRATQATGLQVGGGAANVATEDVWVSESGYSGQTTTIHTGNDEWFSYGYDVNGYAGSAATAVQNFAGIYQVSSGDNLNDLVNEINKGTASRMEFVLSGAANSAATLEATFAIPSGGSQVLNVGNFNVVVYEKNAYADSAAAWTALSATADLVVCASATAAAFIDTLASAVNADTSANVFAVARTGGADWNKVVFFAKSAGTSGNSITFGTNINVTKADQAETWTTTTSFAGTAALTTSGSSDYGYIGLGVTYDGSAGNSVKNANFYELASGGTILDLANAINEGTHARVLMKLSVASTSAVVSSLGIAGASGAFMMDIAGFKVAFSSGGSAVNSAIIGADYILDVSSNTTWGTALKELASAINSNADADVWAVSTNGAANEYMFIARQAGETGNNLAFRYDAEVASGLGFYDAYTATSSLAAASNFTYAGGHAASGYTLEYGGTLDDGGMHLVNACASALAGGNYVLKLTAASAGASHDIQFLMHDTYLSGTGTVSSSDSRIVGISNSTNYEQVEGLDATSGDLVFKNVWTGDSLVTSVNSDSSATTTRDGLFHGGGCAWATASLTYSDATNKYYLKLTGRDADTDQDLVIRNASEVITEAGGNEFICGQTFTEFSAAGWGQIQDASSGSATGATWDGAHIQTQSAAQQALAQLDAAIETKDKQRASLGALQNRLENTITQMSIQAENLQAAESRISDVDVALEMTTFTRNMIMAQAATSMLAQANGLAQLALSVLG